MNMDLIVPQQHGLEVSDDSSATMPVHDVNNDKKGPCEPLLRRFVHFDETNNRYYEAPSLLLPRLDGASLKDRWWSEADYRAFEQVTRRQLQRLQPDHNPWTASWLRVYFTLRLAQTPEAFQQVLASTPLTLDEHTAGFQGTQLEPIHADFQVRRESLLNHIHHVQTAVMDEHDRVVLLEQTSRLHSHAARLYAHIAGLTLAASSG